MRSPALPVLSLTCMALAGCNGSSAAPATPVAIAVEGDDSPSGIFDPSVVSAGGGQAWMAYSSVNYHGDPLVQDVGLRIARSDDGGLSWTHVASVAAPSPATVADPDDVHHSLCGQPTCAGRWVYETSWLVDDASDVAARRWKLFAHQYFLLPGHSPSATLYHLGAIVMWAAASPDQLGGAPTTALRWDLTPATFTGGVNVNDLDAALAGCLVVAEGGATAVSDHLDLVATCPYPAGAGPIVQKIVLLRSTDHASTFRYVATLLDVGDAAAVAGASFFSAPSLLPTEGSDPVLIATPVVSQYYAGCDVIPFADEEAGTLVRAQGLPRIALSVPASPGMYGGACAYDRGLERMGLLLNEVDLAAAPPRFRILRTGRVP